jgi:hypothetical protein
MRTAALTVILALGLGACATGGPVGGYANYDALKVARDACVAKGGTFKLKTEGNPERIDAYTCERK